MTTHEQVCLNDAVDTVKAYRWRDRTVVRLMNRLEPLGPSDKIALLRKVDELLG